MHEELGALLMGLRPSFLNSDWGRSCSLDPSDIGEESFALEFYTASEFTRPLAMGAPFPGFGGSSGGLSWNSSRFPDSRHLARADPGAGDSLAEHDLNRKFKFPVKAATTSGVLALLGDTAAQLRARWVRRQAIEKCPDMAPDCRTKEMKESSLGNHDWLRALRMTTYGFLIYGPASQVWYNFLDCVFWEKTMRNLSVKVALNQVVLGPFVIAVVFAWNSVWQGKLDTLPDLYRNHAVSTLVDGWKFWIPASVLNFGLVPLQARVAFMSSCSIFWNFYLSTTMVKS